MKKLLCLLFIILSAFQCEDEPPVEFVPEDFLYAEWREVFVTEAGVTPPLDCLGFPDTSMYRFGEDGTFEIYAACPDGTVVHETGTYVNNREDNELEFTIAQPAPHIFKAQAGYSVAGNTITLYKYWDSVTGDLNIITQLKKIE